jgi:hypothetical protein
MGMLLSLATAAAARSPTPDRLARDYDEWAVAPSSRATRSGDEQLTDRARMRHEHQRISRAGGTIVDVRHNFGAPLGHAGLDGRIVLTGARVT